MALGVLFIANSHPFMFPGYDMWWHLGNIEAAGVPGAPGYSTRYLWHLGWYRVFEWLPDLDFWDRALLIHRLQFLLTSVLIGLSGYWVLRVIFQRAEMARGELALLAAIGVLVWMLMHGTSSRVVLPWVLWYSINYQIALPFSLLATAALLYAVGMPLTPARRGLMLAVCAASLAAVIGFHVAEAPYFGLSAVALACVYLRGRFWRWLPLLLPLAVAAVYLALQFSYRMPELVRLVGAGDWALLADRIDLYGHHLVNRRSNRALTGWNTLHSTGLVLMAAALLLAWRLRQGVGIRPMVFVLLTGLMPLALLFETSAGILAMVTYPGIAWRFSFASFLFLGIPVFLGVLGLALREAPRWRLGGQMLATVLIGLGVYGHSRWVDPVQITRTYAVSLYQSLDPRKMYFGLSVQEQAALDAAHARLLAAAPARPICTDGFSAYYLFFLKDYRNLYMPRSNINRLATVEHPIKRGSTHACRFPLDGGDLVPLGVAYAGWRYNLRETLGRDPRAGRPSPRNPRHLP